MHCQEAVAEFSLVVSGFAKNMAILTIGCDLGCDREDLSVSQIKNVLAVDRLPFVTGTG